jgi:GTP pyrophosphokinase
VTSKAKQKIKDTLKEEKRKIAEDGKYILQKKLEAIGGVMTQHNLDELAAYYKVNSSLDLLYDIAIKKIDLKEIKEFTASGDRLFPPKPVKIETEDKNETEISAKSYNKKDTELIIFGESSDRIMYTLANCCKPIPGDDVFGFITMGTGW